MAVMLRVHEGQATITEILNTINQYNNSVHTEKSSCINFVHPTTSASLAFMGKRATAIRPQSSEILTIPPVFLSPVLLRKKYGIYPLYTRTDFIHFAANAKATDDKRLPMMKSDLEGVTVCYQTIKKFPSFFQIEDLHKAITELIIELQPNNYIRNLKKLMVFMVNMIMLDGDGYRKGEHYLKLLQNEKKNLEIQFRHQHEKLNNLRKYFEKYVLRIESILKRKTIPFVTDGKFRREILEPYPIICGLYLDNDHLFNSTPMVNELSLNAVKVMFTPSAFMQRLNQKLSELGFSHIKVYGYTMPEILEGEDQEFTAQELFFKAVSLAEVNAVLQKNNNFLKNREMIEKKLAACLTAYLEGKGSEYYTIASWLLKNASTETLVNMGQVLSSYGNYYLYGILQSKSKIDKSYLDNVRNISSSDYLYRLKDMLYLQSLSELRAHIGNPFLVDYSNLYDQAQLNALLEPTNLMSDRNKYLETYLYRLQHYYVVLTRDSINLLDNTENIFARLDFVRDKYSELLYEYKKQHLIIDNIISSELYQSIKEMDNARSWLFSLFKSTASVIQNKKNVKDATISEQKIKPRRKRAPVK